jgi:hypothetical protein
VILGVIVPAERSKGHPVGVVVRLKREQNFLASRNLRRLSLQGTRPDLPWNFVKERHTTKCGRKQVECRDVSQLPSCCNSLNS